MGGRLPRTMKRIILSDGIFEDYTSIAVVTSVQDFEGESTDPLLAPRIPSTEDLFAGSDQANSLTQTNSYSDSKEQQPPTFEELVQMQEDAIDEATAEKVNKFKEANPGASKEDIEKYEALARYEEEVYGTDNLFDAIEAQAETSGNDTRQQDAKNFALEEAKRRRDEENQRRKDAGEDKMTTQMYRDLKEQLEEYYTIMSGLDDEQEEEGVCNLCGSESTSAICDSCRENLDPDWERGEEEEEEEEEDPNKTEE